MLHLIITQFQQIAISISTLRYKNVTRTQQKSIRDNLWSRKFMRHHLISNLANACTCTWSMQKIQITISYSQLIIRMLVQTGRWEICSLREKFKMIRTNSGLLLKRVNFIISSQDLVIKLEMIKVMLFWPLRLPQNHKRNLLINSLTQIQFYNAKSQESQQGNGGLIHLVDNLLLKSLLRMQIEWKKISEFANNSKLKRKKKKLILQSNQNTIRCQVRSFLTKP